MFGLGTELILMFRSPISESVFISGPGSFFQSLPDIMLFGQYYHKMSENQIINVIKFFYENHLF